MDSLQSVNTGLSMINDGASVAWSLRTAQSEIQTFSMTAESSASLPCRPATSSSLPTRIGAFLSQLPPGLDQERVLWALIMFLIADALRPGNQFTGNGISGDPLLSLGGSLATTGPLVQSSITSQISISVAATTIGSIAQPIAAEGSPTGRGLDLLA